MNPAEESAYWDWVAHDSVRIEAELFSTLDLDDCMAIIEQGISPMLVAGATVLDLGCGVGRLTGAFAERYPKVDWVGVDSSPVMVETAYLIHNRPNLLFKLNDGRDLAEFEDRTFDAAYSMTMLQHIPDDAKAGYLAELGRVLKPGGIFRFQFVFEGDTAPLAFPTPIKDMLGWLDKAKLRETDVTLGRIEPGWCWVTATR